MVNNDEMVNDSNNNVLFTNIINNIVQNSNIRIIFNSRSVNINTQLNNENNHEDVPLVLKENILNQLDKYKYNELPIEYKTNNCCPITMENFLDNDDVLKLPCNHIFKEIEIKEWLLNNSHKCPVCRESVGEYEPKIE